MKNMSIEVSNGRVELVLVLISRLRYKCPEQFKLRHTVSKKIPKELIKCVHSLALSVTEIIIIENV